jgi:hypothetical protein
MAIVVPAGARNRPSPVGKLTEQGIQARPNVEEAEEKGSGEAGAFSPSDLRSAYKIPTSGGASQSVTIVDAFDDPNVEEDLNAYRKHYGMSECRQSTGCFLKLNQKGETKNYPSDKYPEHFGLEDWGLEISLDVDMVSTACPECHIRLVEATNNENSNLYAAEKEAASVAGTTEISDSWGGSEYPEETSADTNFNHPGIPTTASAGDLGYGVSYPAASPYVIAVGGTKLKKAEDTRGWEEVAWGGTGSGCSLYEAKPAWQTDPSCAKRIVNDVAADAAVRPGVSVYDSYEYEEPSGAGTGKLGWVAVGGTSASAPLIAGIEAHGGSAMKTEGAEAFYRNTMFDVTSGANGYCGHTYFCEAAPGYDAPTGWGTPDGAFGFEIQAGFQVVTGSTTNLTPTGAQLNGYVNPGGAEASYHFEYGPTTSYGTNVPIPSASTGSGVVWKNVSQSIAGLHTLNGTYHYRLVATKGSTTVDGEDRTFTTQPWTVLATPNHSESKGGGLGRVSCSSLTSCVAAGAYSSGSESKEWALVESWNGSEWTVQSTPKPEGAVGAGLRGVSCASPTACTSVGSFRVGSGVSSPLAERWNGTEWSIQTTPSPTGAKESALTDVSCVSASECIAVGSYVNSSSASVPFAERWNGATWSVQAVPSPEGSKFSVNGVSCTSPSACSAVGYYQNSSGVWVPLAERWNGTVWSIQTPLSPTGAKSVFLEDISCLSSSECIAVGGYATSSAFLPLAERWNGTVWSIQTVPLVSENGEFSGVSCVSSSECTAVGAGLSGTWNGSEWSTEEATVPPQPPNFEGVSLTGISCRFARVCVAVGNYTGLLEGSFGLRVPLAEIRAIKPVVETRSASALRSSEATLNGLVDPEGAQAKYYVEYGTTTSYGSKTSTVTVPSGMSYVEESQTIKSLTPSTTYHFRVVAENSAGTNYGADKTFESPQLYVLPTPSPTGAKSALLEGGVSCVSASACTAVGRYENSSNAEVSLAERWNGSEWLVQSTPNPTGGESTMLFGVSCASSSACMSVGRYNSSGVQDALAESWNGSAWTIPSTPNPSGAKFAALYGVSCTSSSACTAVGNWTANKEGLEDKPLAERWTGTEWQLQSAVEPSGALHSGLAGVSCASSSGCMAVGSYEATPMGSGSKVMAEQWNGTTWDVVSVPIPTGAVWSSLKGVSCASTSECVAVGSYGGSSGGSKTLAEHWNGSEWAIQTTPTSEKGVELNGVSCLSSSSCTASGAYESHTETLAEHWNGTTWAIQATSTPGSSALLDGISCVSSTECMAAGGYSNSEGTKPLAELLP